MISLNTIKTNRAYVTALQSLATENVQAAQSSTVGGGSDAQSLAVYLQNVKNSIARAMVSDRREQEDAAAENIIKLDGSAAGATDVRRVETFTAALQVSAGYDETSTKESPVIWVEMTENGTKSWYRVSMGGVDFKDMTRIEAYALARMMQDTPGWTDLTSADIVAAISNVITKEGHDEPEKAPSADASMVDQIGRYLKSSSTYGANGAYTSNSDAQFVDFFSQTSSARMNARALRLQSLMANIVTGKDGRKSIAPGLYL